MWMPDTEVVDKERDSRPASMSRRGPKNIRLVALPDSILLQAEPKSNEARLFQRFVFSAPIDVEKVTASLSAAYWRSAPQGAPSMMTA